MADMPMKDARGAAERIRDCLVGAVIGAEFGMLEMPRIGGFATADKLGEALGWAVDWDKAVAQPKGNTWVTSLTPLLRVAADAYIRKGGRALPEDFAAALAADESLAERASFNLLDVYSAIERLREGVPARMNGIGACPYGTICVAMVAVGAFHAGDPEQAYIDGAELAAVVQRRPAVDWAALTAAAVADSLRAGRDAAQVVGTVRDLAFKYCKDAYYDLNKGIRDAEGLDDVAFLNRLVGSGRSYFRVYRGEDPIAAVSVILTKAGGDPERALRLAAVRATSDAAGAEPEINAPIVGAVIGALHGMRAFDWAGVPDRVLGLAEGITPLAGVAADYLASRVAVAAETRKVAEAVGTEGGSLLHEKVLGCMLAGAIGNAMGSPMESKMYHEIDALHPGGVLTVLEPWRLEAEDDNQVAMMLLEAYIGRDGLPATAHDYGEQWKKLMDRDMYFYCLRNTYDLLNMGMEARLCGQWNLVTGSSVMCMEPVGLYHMADAGNAYMDGTSMSYMNQRGLDVVAAAILAAATSEAMRLGATAESVVAAALAAAPKGKAATFDRRVADTPYDYLSKCAEIAGGYDDVFAVRAELYEKCLLYHMIDPLELLGFAFAMLLISKGDVRAAAIGGTNVGRDSDTIAGRAAMLAGAISGVGNVPKEWVDMVSPKALARIEGNAKKFSDLIIKGKVPMMEDRLRSMGCHG
ncbi:MAG: ADP-ribosylglycohydrolase family protein [Oscillospiraceae bacterium]|nr:ADP-ribosylglycohydrolase family protein [Oscillospiraceae bacterium]